MRLAYKRLTHITLGVDRNIMVNFRHNLVEVKHETREAVFELLDSEKEETETFQVRHTVWDYKFI